MRIVSGPIEHINLLSCCNEKVLMCNWHCIMVDDKRQVGCETLLVRDEVRCDAETVFQLGWEKGRVQRKLGTI